MTTPALVGIDWGTTRFRAYLIDETGVVIDRIASDDGIMAVKPGGFPAVLALRCGMWLARDPNVPVLMAGMVGSRNGWVEAPYRACPASPRISTVANTRTVITFNPTVCWIGPETSRICSGIAMKVSKN